MGTLRGEAMTNWSSPKYQETFDRCNQWDKRILYDYAQLRNILYARNSGRDYQSDRQRVWLERYRGKKGVMRSAPPRDRVRAAVENEIQEYLNAGCLPDLRREDGTPGFPGYADGRISVLSFIRKRWKYSFDKLKQAADYEENLINSIAVENEIDFSNIHPLAYYRMYLRQYLRHLEFSVKSEQDAKSVESAQEKRKYWEAELSFVKGKKWEDLSAEKREKIERVVWWNKNDNTEYYDGTVLRYRNQLVVGFSPKMSFEKYGDDPIDDAIYVFEFGKNSGIKIYFSDWFFHSDTYRPGDFIATPEFLMEVENDSIKLTIRDPKEVDSKYLRRIEKIYSFVRQQMGQPRKKWGEKCGKREIFQKRDKQVQEWYRDLRSRNPKVAAERSLDKLAEMTKKDSGKNSHTKH
jgi:hypothetical protein